MSDGVIVADDTGDTPSLAALHDDLVDGRPVRPQGMRERLVHYDDVLAAVHV